MDFIINKKMSELIPSKVLVECLSDYKTEINLNATEDVPESYLNEILVYVNVYRNSQKKEANL